MGDIDGREVESVVGDDSSTFARSTIDGEIGKDYIFLLMRDPKGASMSGKGGKVCRRKGF